MRNNINREMSRSASVWHYPSLEISTEGRCGEVLNTCPLCGCEATKTGTNKYDLFKCSSEYCGAEFEETGTGPELLPCCFGEGLRYSKKLSNGQLLEFLIVFPSGEAIIKTNKGMLTVDIVKDGDSEFFVAPPSLGGQGEKVYPYGRKA